MVTVHSSQASTSHFCRLRYTAGIAPSMRRAQPQRSGVRDATVGQNNVALHIAITERSTMDRSPSHLFRAVNLPASRALPNIPHQSPCHSVRIFVMITMCRYRQVFWSQRCKAEGDGAGCNNTWKGANLKTVLITFPGTYLRSRSVTEQSGERIPRYENVQGE